jgi:hypothetical protein
VRVSIAVSRGLLLVVSAQSKLGPADVSRAADRLSACCYRCCPAAAAAAAAGVVLLLLLLLLAVPPVQPPAAREYWRPA